MLGIEVNVPSKVDVKHDDSERRKPGSSSSHALAAESVKTAWEEADMALESDEEEETAAVEEEESRYRAADSRASQPPKKRRRTGKEKDMHTVYTTDDEDDAELDKNLQLHIGGADDGVSEEEAEYVVHSHGSESEQSDRPGKRKKDAKRSYWLSKGIGLGNDVDEYSDAV